MQRLFLVSVSTSSKTLFKAFWHNFALADWNESIDSREKAEYLVAVENKERAGYSTACIAFSSNASNAMEPQSVITTDSYFNFSRNVKRERKCSIYKWARNDFCMTYISAKWMAPSCQHFWSLSLQNASNVIFRTSGQIAIFETAGPHVHLEHIIASSSMFFHSSSNELQMKLLVWGKCHHQMGRPPMGFAGFAYGFPIGYYWLWIKLPWAASKFKGNFLLLCWLCASTNFVYSNHVGVMQRAHNSSTAALSHQISDLRTFQGVYPPATYVDVYQRLILSYFILPPWH